MAEKEYTCSDCGKTNINPFSNGDGKDRCEKCAVAYYYANRFVTLLAPRAADGAYSCSCGDVFPNTPFCLVCGDRAFTPRQ